MTPNEKKIIDELKSVPITDKTREQIRWNIAEQQFLVRLINLRDEATKEEICDALSEVVRDQNTRMFNTLDEQTKLIKGMALDMSEIKIRLSLDERLLKILEARLDAKKIRLDAIEKDVNIIKKKIKAGEKVK